MRRTKLSFAPPPLTAPLRISPRRYEEAQGASAGGIFLGSFFEDVRTAEGAAAPALSAIVVPAGETVRVIGSAGPGKKDLCVDVTGPATAEDFIRRLLPDPLPAAGSATSAASYAARHKGAGDRTTQHHRLSKLEPLGLDPSDGATLIKGTASLWRHFIAPEAAIRSSAAAAATAAAVVVASSPGESRLDTLRERARAATAPKSAADALGPQGNSRRLGSGKR